YRLQALYTFCVSFTRLTCKIEYCILLLSQSLIIDRPYRSSTNREADEYTFNCLILTHPLYKSQQTPDIKVRANQRRDSRTETSHPNPAKGLLVNLWHFY